MFRYGLDCLMFQEEVWAAGGYDGDEEGIVEILNLETETWRKGPSMVKHRYRFTMEAIANTLMVFGGYGGGKSTMEKLVGGKWIVEPMQYDRIHHASVTLPCP